MSLDTGDTNVTLTVDAHTYLVTGETTRDAFLLAMYKFANSEQFEKLTYELGGHIPLAFEYSVETFMPSPVREKAKKPRYPAKFERTVAHAYVTHLRECAFQCRDINYDWRRLGDAGYTVQVALEGGGVYLFDGVVPDSILHLSRKARGLRTAVVGTFTVNDQSADVKIDNALITDKADQTILNVHRAIPNMIKKTFGCDLLNQRVVLRFLYPHEGMDHETPFVMDNGQIRIVMH
jgi:hypothetical protein